MPYKDMSKRAQYNRDNHRTHGRRYKLKALYQMSLQDWEDLFDSQGRACAICLVADAKKYCVDHDHGCCSGEYTCGQCVRGILCSFCNSILGRWEDQPLFMQRATDYVMRGKDGSLV